MGFLKEQVNREPISGFGLAKQLENHSSQDRSHKLNNFVVNRVHVDDNYLVLFCQATIHRFQSKQLC